MKMTKARLWGLIMTLVLLVPLGINLLIGLPQDCLPFPVVGNGDSWLSFWASYLCAAATLIMVIYTSGALKQNREQLEDRQRLRYRMEGARRRSQVLLRRPCNGQRRQHGYGHNENRFLD